MLAQTTLRDRLGQGGLRDALRHLPGAHDQKSHGQKGGGFPTGPRVGSTDEPSTAGAFADSLNDAEKATIKDYTASGWRDINSSLREERLGYGAADDPRIKTLDEALDKAPPLPDNSILYRGMTTPQPAGPSIGLSDDDIFERNADYLQDKYPVGAAVDFGGGFVSTSTDLTSPLDHSVSRYTPGAIFEIKATSGAPLHRVSEFDDEFEVLLPRTSTFRVVGFERRQSMYDIDGEDRPRTIIQLEQENG